MTEIVKVWKFVKFFQSILWSIVTNKFCRNFKSWENRFKWWYDTERHCRWDNLKFRQNMKSNLRLIDTECLLSSKRSDPSFCHGWSGNEMVIIGSLWGVWCWALTEHCWMNVWYLGPTHWALNLHLWIPWWLECSFCKISCYKQFGTTISWLNYL